MKKFIAVVLIATLMTVLFAACAGADTNKTDENQTKTETPVYKNALTIAEEKAEYNEPTITDYAVDPDFDVSKVRLKIYNGTGWEAADEDCCFDPDKPTFLFAHGLGPDLHAREPEGIYEKGYNVLSFLRGCLSGNSLGIIKIGKCIWENIDCYTTNDKDLYTSDKFDCTVPELYLARYCDFFKNYPGYSKPIIMTGHSYGGQLTTAMSGLMTKYLNEGRLNPRIYPEKFMLIDPYYDTLNVEFNCKWFGQKFTGSSVGAAGAIFDYDAENNVAIELLRTSPLVELAKYMNMTGSDDGSSTIAYTKEVERKVMYVELEDVTQIDKQLSGLYDVGARKHSVAEDFTLTVYRENKTYDVYKYKSGEIMVGALDVYTDEFGNPLYGKFAPASLDVAQRGMHLDANTNGEDFNNFSEWTISHTYYDEDSINWGLVEMGEEMEEEDKLYMTYSWFTEDYSKIAGFVYADVNANGKTDDGASSRLNGVTVELKDANGKTLKTTETKNVYYEFEVEKNKAYTVEIHSLNYADQKATVTANGACNISDFLAVKK